MAREMTPLTLATRQMCDETKFEITYSAARARFKEFGIAAAPENKPDELKAQMNAFAVAKSAYKKQTANGTVTTPTPKTKVTTSGTTRVSGKALGRPKYGTNSPKVQGDSVLQSAALQKVDAAGGIQAFNKQHAAIQSDIQKLEADLVELRAKDADMTETGELYNHLVKRLAKTAAA